MTAASPNDIFSARALESSVSEESFAGAYLIVTDMQRGLLKKCIAQQFSWQGMANALERTGYVRHSSPLKVWHRSRPRDWALVVLDETDGSPAQLLASLLPPLLAGVPLIAAFHRSGQWSHAQLVAMELAGVEAVFSAKKPDFLEALAGELVSHSPRGILVSLGSDELARDTFSLSLDAGLGHVALRPARRLGIWGGAGQASWDLDAVGFCHPGVEMVRVTDDPSAPAKEGGPGLLSGIDGAKFDALLVPEGLAGDALGRARLVLCPGQECFWAWPDVRMESFWTTAAGFGEDLAGE
jgi:hypothetical protein